MIDYNTINFLIVKYSASTGSVKIIKSCYVTMYGVFWCALYVLYTTVCKDALFTGLFMSSRSDK